MEMLVAEDITEYIFHLLSKRKYVVNQNKTVTLNFHCNDDDTYLKDQIKKRVGTACVDIGETFEIEGPVYKSQTCFLLKKPHPHIEFTIKSFE